jgi:hypothetical protein
MVNDVVLCRAPEVGTYQPSDLQIEQFCTTHRVESCPVFNRNVHGEAKAGFLSSAGLF